MELAREVVCIRVCAVLRDELGLWADRPEDGRVGIQGRRRIGAGGGFRAGVVEHGPCGGLGKSREPHILLRARGWGGGRMAGAPGSVRIGAHVVRNGRDAGVDCPLAAVGRATLPCAKYGHWPCWLSSAVRHFGPAVSPRESSEIKVRAP